MRYRRAGRIFDLVLALALMALSVRYLFVLNGNVQLFEGFNQTEASQKIDLPKELDSFLKFGSININTATKEQLAELPGIGNVLAARIVEYRTANGPFSFLDELDQMKGIGKKRVTAMRGFAYAEVLTHG